MLHSKTDDGTNGSDSVEQAHIEKLYMLTFNNNKGNRFTFADNLWWCAAQLLPLTHDSKIQSTENWREQN